MTVIVEGLPAVLARLDRLVMRSTDAQVWGAVLETSIEGLRRYAVSISPVVTGSYRDSHTTTVRGKKATLFIDPAARNGNIPVTRYAGSVEIRHQVYARTARRATGRARVDGRRLLQEIAR